MNAGQLILLIFGLIAGASFIIGAVRAILAGNFKSPQKIIYGMPSGIVLINRKERPVAFWFCTVSYCCFGLSILVCIWFIV